MQKLKNPIGYVDIRFSAHATEDSAKVQQAALNLFPTHLKEEVAFKKNATKGHYGNPIILFETRIKDKKIIEAFVETLSTKLNDLDKQTVLEESDLLIEKSNLYLRLDKQAAFEDEVKLQKTDPIHIRIHFKRREGKNILEICRELGLTL